MDRVNAIAQEIIPDSQFAAVVIGVTDRDQRHIGILHREEGGNPRVLHLAWHCRLLNDEPVPTYFSIWIAPPIHPERLRQLSALCRKIWKANQENRIPYAFSNPEGAFDSETARIVLGPTRFGLTCASFVLAVFHFAGLRLVKLDSWPTNRPGDREWQESIIAKLQRWATQEHIDHVRNEVGVARYRPEEVGAAAAVAPPEVNLTEIEELSKTILRRLEELKGGNL